MESVGSYYKEEAYFSPDDKYLEPQAWLSCDEQQSLFHYHYSQSKGGLSYANRSTPLHDLSRLPHTPEQQEGYHAPKNGVNAEISYDDGSYYFAPSHLSPEWNYSRPVAPNGVYPGDVNYQYTGHVPHRRPKSKERNRKVSDHYEHSSPWNGHPELVAYDPFYANDRRQNLRHSRDVIDGSPAYYYDVYHQSSGFPPAGNPVMWHPWPDVSRELDRSAAMSPSSPLDSGLSSQSVASTPNSELEPLGNWEQTSSGNCDWVQKSYQENIRAEQCSCPSEMCAISSQSSSDNTRRNPHRTINHASLRDCHATPTRGMHYPDACFSKNASSDKNTEVQCKCHSSVESVSDSYELRNGSWTFQPESRELNHRDRYFDDMVSSDGRFHRLPVHSSGSDGTSDSTLKGSSVNCNFLQRQCRNVDESSDVTESDQHRQKVDSEPSSTDSKSLYRKQRKKNAKKAEKALCELEEIYNQLKLDDFDLLDRAERRDLPTAHQVLGEDSYKSQPLTRSKSDTFYEIFGRAYGMGYSKSSRAPPLRRSGIPDRIADDMAIRKQQKPPTKFEKPVCTPSSYLLCSSHFTPSIPPVVKEFPFLNKPDVEYDDLSYRKYFQPKAYHDLPQPPFGIPLHPMVQCPNSNYLHATPSNVPRALCHARGNPDLVRDDMAFRNLRKDNPQTICPG